MPLKMKAFSQYGEDIFIIINRLINKDCKSGIIVEVGALDGLKYSNSKLFEDYFGFKCILVEPSPSFKKIPTNRPNASWHCCALAQDFGVEMFAGNSAVAGMTKHMPQSYVDRWQVDSMNKFHVLTMPLNAIVKIEQLEYIDFLSIDVQGAELDVLKGFDFSIPVGIVCIEMEDHDLQKNQECRDILSRNGLTLFGSAHISEFWIDANYFRSAEISDKTCNPLGIDSFEPVYAKRRFLKALVKVDAKE
jgi:FkbM family methyltransferase